MSLPQVIDQEIHQIEAAVMEVLQDSRKAGERRRLFVLLGILVGAAVGFVVSTVRTNSLLFVGPWALAGGAAGLLLGSFLSGSPVGIDSSARRVSDLLVLIIALITAVTAGFLLYEIPNVATVGGLLLCATAIAARLVPADWRYWVLWAGCASMAVVALFGGLANRNLVLVTVGLISGFGAIFLMSNLRRKNR